MMELVYLAFFLFGLVISSDNTGIARDEGAGQSTAAKQNADFTLYTSRIALQGPYDSDPLLQDQGVLLGVAQQAYNEMIELCKADPVISRNMNRCPGAMTVLAVNSKLYLASSMKSWPESTWQKRYSFLQFLQQENANDRVATLA